ncbi:MAG: tRNA adenosine(34) deaminase TadA [Oscillospiraceae bacterium]|nr:tRNA adenosine(34) deaminase TadA [Oscillospiraceae bacterium]
MTDTEFMKRAIARAKAASAAGEVPIGAVLVKDGKILSTGRNMRENRRNALLHAEIVAIDRACKKLGAWRLEGCTLYVTMEPCPMCAGAIINSRISRVVFGCYDRKAGVYGSVLDLQDYRFNHYYEVTGGVLEEECAGLLSDFFATLRANKK